MASLGDPGDPPPLPDSIDCKLTLEQAMQRANLAGTNPNAQGLGDIIRINVQDEKVFTAFMNKYKSHQLITNKRIYKNDDHSKDYIMSDVNDLQSLRTLLYEYCLENNLITHPDSIGPSVTMIGAAPHDIRKSKKSTFWNRPIIPDHFLIKFTIKDSTLKQEITTNNPNALLRILRTKLHTYLQAISTKFPQITLATQNYLLQEQHIFAKDSSSDITISLCITSRAIIADMKTEYLKHAPSRPLTGVWAQGISGRVPQMPLNDTITLTNASFPSYGTHLFTPTNNNHNSETHDTIIIPTKTVTSTADHNRINKILASYFKQEKTSNSRYTLESYRLAYEHFINENPAPSPIPALPPPTRIPGKERAPNRIH
jgi:hypothetical protein